MSRPLPPIFAKARFGLGANQAPAVVFRVDREMDDLAGQLVAKMDGQDTRTEHFGRWWIEYDHIGILATMTGEREHTLQAWGKRTGVRAAFPVNDDVWWSDTYDGFTDDQKLTAALYLRAAILLASYTDAQADVSVLTGTKKAPSAWERQGDTLRYASISDLRSTSGLTREYQRPADPSGVRMREHEVRGHWRTFSTGVRVWVRSHKRGDPDIGRVQRVISGARQ